MLGDLCDVRLTVSHFSLSVDVSFETTARNAKNAIRPVAFTRLKIEKITYSLVVPPEPG